MADVNVHILHCGSCDIDQSIAYEERSLHPYPMTGLLRPQAKKIRVPVSAYLIEHPRGLALIDTGWHDEVRVNPKKHLGFLHSRIVQPELPKGQAIHEQLKRKGIRTSDLDTVILTHLHTDHVSGVLHVADAKKIMTSEYELKAAKNPFVYVRKMWNDVKIRTFQTKYIPYGPYNQGVDVFDDGKVYLIHTPGHTPGHHSVLVSTTNGWVCLASDAGYSTSSWEQNRLPGIRVNKKQAKDSLDYIREFSKRDDCLAVIANHDPAITPQIL